MEFRKVFDCIPDKFDKWRPRYCEELFNDVIEFAKLDNSKSVLEIGPGTGQATEPILKTGCSYLAIELGEHLAEFMKNRFSTYDNFSIVNNDFVTYDFKQSFDMIFSAATIQWIPEEIGFPKVNSLLKHGGTFAMMMTKTDKRSANEELYQKIQDVYTKYFQPEERYNCKLNYRYIVNYGFTDIECKTYLKERILSADDYIEFLGTNCENITLQEPYRSKFYEGIRSAINDAGGTITLKDNIILYLVKKL